MSADDLDALVARIPAGWAQVRGRDQYQLFAWLCDQAEQGVP